MLRDKLYTIETILRGPEGIIKRSETSRTTESLADEAMIDLGARLDQVDQDTEEAENETDD